MLPAKKKSKRGKILEMLSQGHDVDYIASKLKTTKQNVYKEKSNQKSREYAKNFRVRQAIQSKRRSRRIADSELDKTQDSILDDNAGYGSYKTLRRPTKKEYSMLFTEFLAGKKPEEIIAEHGIDPEIVEKEYQRFLKLRGMGILELQRSILKMTSTYSDDLKPLINKLESGTMLSNEEVIELVNSGCNNHVLKLISDVTATLPGPIIRPSCSRCERYISGILLDITNPNGSRIWEEEKENYVCSGCMQ
jgi:preprotein translocase subunit Sss1